jgi:hypothetical protein
MTTILADIHRLHAEGSFPVINYSFFYPELKLHKTVGLKCKRPATIEMICGPFLIVEHEEVQKYNEELKKNEQTYPAGVVIFYNRRGSSNFEFMYLFDLLTTYQMFDGESLIRIRVVNHSPHTELRSNYRKAIEMYAHDWGFDKHKKERLDSIELEIVEIQKTSFSQTEIAWER